MAKLLYGRELALYIKNRQAKQVRALRQAHGLIPKLVIIQSINASDIIETYVRIKKQYAEDILIEVDIVRCSQVDMKGAIDKANRDTSVHGIVLQLPIDDIKQTDEIVERIRPEKDVDGLGSKAKFVSATAEAIDWLIAGLGIELASKKIVIVGRGRLIGMPLSNMWRQRGLNVSTLDKTTTSNDEIIRGSELVVSATGTPGLLTNKVISSGTIVIDAGTASESGVIVGDASDELYNRDDITITAQKGGVGPLTICLMFDHVIRACQAAVIK